MWTAVQEEGLDLSNKEALAGFKLPERYTPLRLLGAGHGRGP